MMKRVRVAAGYNTNRSIIPRALSIGGSPFTQKATDFRAEAITTMPFRASQCSASSSFGMMFQQRRFYCEQIGGRISPEMITIEEIEFETADGEVHSSSGERKYTFSDETENSCDDSGLVFTDVLSVDAFAKSKILNYIGRFQSGPAANTKLGPKKAGGQLPLQSLNKEEMEGTTVFRARLKLPVPYPLNPPIAEGIGENEKDAELLAAMHAERLLDALGVQLFQLPSKQKRHAENARSQGRYAPMPGDPVVTDNARMPPPMRMVALQAKVERNSNSFSTTTTTTTTVHEVHEVGSTPSQSSTATASANFGQKSAAGVGNAATMGSMSANDIPVSNATPKAPLGAATERFAKATAAAAAAPAAGGNTGNYDSSGLFDPTEGSTWQMVNTTSQRFAPRETALILPCVFDKNASSRVEAYFKGMQIDMRSRTAMKHVMVPGYATRMFQCDISVDPEDGLVARGKANDKNTALSLACMHAELLIDATGRALFPTDATEQHKHAVQARGYGRWAMDPVLGEMSPPPELAEHDLPLPLKQQAGGDEALLLDERTVLSNKSPSEKLVMNHNDLCNRYYSDFVEVAPKPDLLEEAPKILQEWAKKQNNYRYYDLFVTTRMGDYVRASFLLPVPDYLGLRGGNGVGRTSEQAIQLCALHALDTLNLCNVEVFGDDPAKQADYVKKRQALGLAVPTAPLCPKTSSGQPHLPGYYIDPGKETRPVPQTDDVIRVASMKPLEAFETLKMSEADILNIGVETKQHVQQYMRQMTGEQQHQASSFFTGFAKIGNVHTICFLPIMLPESAVAGVKDPAKKQKLRRVLAIGASMKKKDADRCCYLHAAAILKTFGVDVKNFQVLGKKQKKKLEALKREREEAAKKAAAEAGAKGATSGNAATSTIDATASTATTADATNDDDAFELPPLPMPMMHPLMEANLKSQEKERMAVASARGARRPFSPRNV